MTSFCRLLMWLVLLFACRDPDTSDTPLNRALKAYAPGVTLGMRAQNLKSRYNLTSAEYFGYYDREFQTRDGFRSLGIMTDPRPRGRNAPLASARVSAVYLDARADSAGVRARAQLSSILGQPTVGCKHPIDGPPVTDVGPTDIYYWPRPNRQAVLLTLPVLPLNRRAGGEVVRLMFFLALDSSEVTPLPPGPCLRDGRAPSPQR